MPNAIYFKLDRLGDVVANELKAEVIPPLAQVGLTTGEGVVETKNLLTGLHHSVDQMGTEETSAAGHQVADRTSKQAWATSGDGLTLSRDQKKRYTERPVKSHAGCESCHPTCKAMAH